MDPVLTAQARCTVALKILLKATENVVDEDIAHARKQLVYHLNQLECVVAEKYPPEEVGEAGAC